MQGSEKQFLNFMQGSTFRYVIPVYQRNYDWKMENCRRLYDDLVKVIRKNRPNHFFGSIVFILQSDGANANYMIIDGQQRLTTVTLLLLAMYNTIRDGLVKPERASLGDQIYEEYLVDKYSEGPDRIKLKPVKNDRAALEKLFDGGEEEFIRDSNLTTNYRYFYTRIQDQEITIDELFRAISLLQVICISLKEEDNPQLVFESLNSTGLALSEGDKIRNYILMNLPAKKQEQYYEKYWNRIEDCTDYDVSSFIRDYLSVKQQKIPSQSRVYPTFQEYVEQNGLETEDLLKELLSYASWYRILLHGGTGDKELDACIYRLNFLETTITRPFFLEVLSLNSEGRISGPDMLEIFQTTETYIFRRLICDIPTSSLNKTFLALNREILRYDGTDENYLEKFKYAISSKTGSARFPDDSEFIDRFSTCQLYLMRSKNRIYALERFNNYGTREDNDIYEHYISGDYSVEHIMPQQLTPAWKEMLGDDYEQIYDTWIHRPANLTLTAYNSKYSNAPFEQKKNMKNGFRESGIRMNMYISQFDRWGEAELEERSQHLMDQAVQIWPYPESRYQPDTSQQDSYTLDDEVNLTGRKLSSYIFKDETFNTGNWIDMYMQVIRMLYAEDNTKLLKVACSSENYKGLSPYFSNTKEKSTQTLISSDGPLYAGASTDTETKLSILRRVFELYDEDPSDLVFILQSVDSDERFTENRYQLRQKYWTMALPRIKEANQDSGCFGNVENMKSNTLNGYFGILGFSIACTANFDTARVELYLSKAEKEQNKSAFDYLYSRRAEIEKVLGETLFWNRNDENKASRIYVLREKMGIEDESSWQRMSDFHTDWSRRFYEVFVPLLKGWEQS